MVVSGRLAGTIALIVGGVFYQISFTNLPIVLPLVNSSLHLGGLSGLVVGAFPLGAAALFIPSGVVALRFGARTTLLVGLIVEGVAGTFSALAQDPLELTVLRVVSGAGAALFYAPAVGLLAALFPAPNRAVVIGLFASLSVAVGATAGFLGGAFLGLAFGWRVLLAVSGFGTLAVAAVGWVWVPAPEGPTSPDSAAAQWARFLAVLRSPAIWFLSLGVSGFYTAGYLGPAFLSTFVRSVHGGWGLEYAGIVGSLAFVAFVPGAFFGGRWSEGGGDRRRILAVFGGPFGALIFLIPLANRLELVFLFAVLGFLFGGALATTLSMPSYLSTTSGNRTPSAVGIIESVGGFARFGGAATFGVIELTMGFGWAWGVTGLIALGTLPLLLGVPANRNTLNEGSTDSTP